VSGSEARSVARLALLLVVLSAGDAYADDSAAGDSTALEGLPIARVEIVARDVYEPVPSGRLAAGYRLANQLHVRTREKTIRQQLLLAPGQPWSEARGRESVRKLRQLDVLEPTSLTARREGDSVVVRVETRDAWTTTPEFNLESGGGQLFGSFAFAERNLFGLAKSVAIAYHEDPIGIGRSASYDDPQFLFPRLRLGFFAGNGSEGAGNRVVLEVPFYAEDAPLSFGVRWRRTTSISHLFQGGSEVADFDQRLEESRVFAGIGRRQDGTILRMTASMLGLDRRYGPSRLDPEAPPQFAGGEQNLRLRRIDFTVQLWRPRPIEARVVNQLEGIEDFDLGPSLMMTAGLAPRFLGSGSNEAYGEIRLQTGRTLGPRSFALVDVDASSRFVPDPREAVGRVQAFWVNQTLPRQTLVFGAWGVAGLEPSREFQVVVGGLNGLRAYSVHELAGTQVWRLNAENRILLGQNYLNLFSAGAAVFYDVGRAWGPGSLGEGWHSDAGIGLRLSFPRSTLSRVARFDVAWPIDPAINGRREAVYSFGSSQAF
jgi:hypothetical protein